MKYFLTLATIVATINLGWAQTEISGVTLKEQLTVEGKKLTLNGGGLREKLWLDLYVGALYLNSKSSDAQKIINADEIMVMRLHIVSGLITSEKMVDAVEEGFDKATGGKTDALRPRIDQFKKAFSK